MNNFLKFLFNSPTFTTWSAFIVQFGSSVFILPLILLKFSDAEIAAWFLLYMIINLSMLADSGFGPTIVRVVSYYYSGASRLPECLTEFNSSQPPEHNKINFEKLELLVGILNTVYLFLGLLAVLLLLVCGRYIVANTFGMCTDNKSLYAAFYLVVLRSFFSIQAVKWSSFIQGVDKVAHIKRAEALANFVKLSLMFFLILSGYKIFSLMLLEALYGALMLVYSWSYVLLWFKRNDRSLNFRFSFNKKIISNIWPSTWRLGSIQYGSYLINYGSGIIVSQVNNAEVIAGFMLAQRITFFIRQVAQAPVYANLPRIFQLMSKKDFEEIKLFTVSGVRYSFAILIISLIMFVVTGNFILEQIHIDTRLPDTSILILMCISVLLEMHHSIHAQIYMGTNYIPFVVPTLLSGVFILLGGFSVVGMFGIVGVVFVQFIVQLCCNNWYPVYLNLSLLKWKFRDYLFDVFWIRRKGERVV